MKNILLITLSNIGDAVCTTPVLQNLLDRPDCPKVSVLVGPKVAPLFQVDPAVREVIVYDKHVGWTEKLSLVRKLRRKGFDEVVDLRNTLLPVALLGWRGVRSLFCHRTAGKGHAVRRHLRRAFSGSIEEQKIGFRVCVPQEARGCALQRMGIDRQEAEPVITVAPGAASDLKRWPVERFAQIIRRVLQAGYGRVTLVGGPENRALAAELKKQVAGPMVDLVGQTSLVELAAVLKCSALLISNDSGPMHLAAAVGTPVVAVFGPSDPQVYGPFGSGHTVVRRDLSCSPCAQARCPLGTHACIQDLSVEDVWEAVERTLRAQTFLLSVRKDAQIAHAKKI